MTRGLARVDIRARAAKFAERYESAKYERGEAQTFYNDFFKVFGVERLGNAVFERHVKKVDGRHHGYIDLLWPKVLLAEHKSMGRDLQKALEQAEDYLIELPGHERPQCMLACDFQNFLLVDLDTNEKYEFKLSELPDRIDLFDFMRGRKRLGFASQEPVSVKAAEIMGGVYDALRDNGYPEHDAARLLTKLTFCFFADDTGIFSPRGILLDYLENTSDDGADLGPRLVDLFDVLNTSKEKRQKNLPAELQQFEHVNGDLFGSSHATPRFDANTRTKILQAAEFNWQPVSPAIFGSLFQSVMSPKERRAHGAHYTTEENIMKVAGPLFLDGLRAELEKIKARKDAGRKNALDKFRKKLACLRFLDPACGAGNFLIVSYKQLRRLELDAIKETYPPDPKTERFDVAGMPLVNVDQFYGIELNGFSAKIAEAAMWMMDHLMNNEISAVYGDSYVRLPLKERANILNADALETDWNQVLPAKQCSYILGNPPFGGPRRINDDKRAQIKRISGLPKGGGNLDYVACWFIEASRYARPETKIGFVATNSITQGEQVGQFWPLVYGHGKDISFAHESFKWGSDAAGKAQVHVVVVGLEHKRQMVDRKKRLFCYEDAGVFETEPRCISPYMLGMQAATPIVKKTCKPINGLPRIADGAVPLDGGNLTLTDQERVKLLSKEPEALKFLRPFIDADDFLACKQRWLLYLKDVELGTVKRDFPEVMKRVNATRSYRMSCKRPASKKLANRPTELAWGVVPSSTFLVIPRVTSENRKYVPIGYMEPPAMTSNRVMVLEGADLGVFGLLTSWMHMIWLRVVGGRLENRFSYSASVVYNTFPTPAGSLKTLESYAHKVLDSRAAHPSQTLKQLYDPETMPPDLVNAHKRLDRAVEKMYSDKPFLSDRDRLAFLLERYGAMVQKNQKLIPEPKPRKKAKRRA